MFTCKKYNIPSCFKLSRISLRLWWFCFLSVFSFHSSKTISSCLSSSFQNFSIWVNVCSGTSSLRAMGLRLKMAPWTPSKLLMQSNSVEYQTYISLIIMILAKWAAEGRKRSEFIISSRARRVYRAWYTRGQLQNRMPHISYLLCNLSVSALTSWSIFCFHAAMTRAHFHVVFMKCLFIVCETIFTLGKQEWLLNLTA